MKINIARLSEIHLIEKSYNENGYFIKYFEEILNSIEKYYEISIVTPMSSKNERLFLNSSIMKEYKYLNDLKYEPKIDKKLDGEILLIFPPDDLKDSQKILENGQNYNDLIETFLEDFHGLVFYFDYNNSDFFNKEITKNKNYKFLHIHNNPGKDTENEIFLNLSSLLFNQRTVTKNYNNFYYNISLMTDSIIKENDMLLNNKIEVVCINNKKILLNKNLNIKVLDELKYKDYLKQIINSNAIYIDNNKDLLYDERFILASTYSLPIMINKVESSIKIPENLFIDNISKTDDNKINIDTFLINKNNTSLSRELRTNISEYISEYNPKYKISCLIENEINKF